MLLGPSLTVIKLASARAVQPGEHLTYTLHVINNGTVSLTTTVTDILPLHVTPGGVLTWTPSTLLPGDSWTETVAVTVHVGYLGPLANVVQVTSLEGVARVYTNVVAVEEPLAGLSAVNDSPTLESYPTTLTATVAAGSDVGYAWAFGDGQSGSGAVVSHIYPGYGTYTAVVTASNGVSLLTATTSVTITQDACWVRLNNDPADYITVQAAVNASTDPADVVKVAGYCTGVNNYGGLSQHVYLGKTLTLQGGYTTTNWTVPDPVANPTTLDAQGQGRVLYIVGNVSPRIEGLHITGGDATGLHGGFGNNDSGGGMFVFSAPVVISNCQIYGNDGGGFGGGVYLWLSAATLSKNSITANTADGGAGLSLQESPATLAANVITANTASVYGGGVLASQSNVTLQGNTIHNNYSGGIGGGAFLYYGGTLISNTVSANTAQGEGGGLFVYHSNTVLSGNAIVSNTTAVSGGGLYLEWNNEVTLFRNLIGGNSASAGGGGVALHNSDVLLEENTITGNSGSEGGGLWLDESDATLTGNTILSNSADYGGGLYLEHNESLLAANTIRDNTALSRGGGIYLWEYAGTMVNNVVADNWVGIAGSGLYAGSSSPHLVHTTLARNDGGDGSGIAVINGSIALTNTVLVSHTTGITVASGGAAKLEATLWGSGPWANGQDWAGDGTILTGTVNLWGDPAFVDPDAGDYHIGPGSDAIDAGMGAGVATDIDGQPRPMGTGYDIGADEFPIGLAVAKQANDDLVETGSLLTYTLYVTNTGIVSLTATISDALPPHVAPGGSLVWTPVPLLPGEEWTETVVVTVEMGYVGPLTNVVQVSSEEGATGAYTNTVAVLDVPIAGLVAANDSPTELGTSTTLTATIAAGTHVTYSWAFGDGNTGGGAVVSHTYPAVGVYAAVVTASNSASQLTATTSVTITDVPIEGLTAINDSPTDLGIATALTATVAAGSNVTYTWAFGDGNTGGGAMVSHTYPAVGVYAAVVTASNSVSQLTATTSVTITDAPIEGLTAINDSPTELGVATALTATVAAGSNVNYTWTFGDGDTGAGAMVSHTYPAVGVYAAVVTASNSVGQLTATTSVTVTQSSFLVYLPLVLKNP
jgi:uncharacterized repeat protein (TIGR01451 family)